MIELPVGCVFLVFLIVYGVFLFVPMLQSDDNGVPTEGTGDSFSIILLKNSPWQPEFQLRARKKSCFFFTDRFKSGLGLCQRHDFLLQKFEEIVIVSPAMALVLITTKASPTVIRDAMEKSKG